MQKVRKYQNAAIKFTDAFFAPSVKSIEVILALLCFMFGMWIVIPYHTGFSPQSNYSVLLAMFSEEVWGVIFLAISFIQFSLLKSSNKDRLFCLHRKAILLIEFCIWIAIAASFFIASQSTAVPTYTTIALLTAYAMIRVGHNE